MLLHVTMHACTLRRAQASPCKICRQAVAAFTSNGNVCRVAGKLGIGQTQGAHGRCMWLRLRQQLLAASAIQLKSVS